jgi:cell division protein FtsZ
VEALKVVVVGVGDAGGRIVDALHAETGESASLVAVNTDTKALADGKATTKIQIGSECARGLGAGGDPELGRKAAMEDLEMLRGLFTDASVVMVLAGLGGGTGSGAAPVLIDTAKKAGALVLSFVTLPFDFEGRGKIRVADAALGEVRSTAHTTFVVPNERLFRFVNRDNLVEAFAGADEVLERGVRSVWRMLTKPSFIRIDMADLQKVAEPTGGTATFAYGEGTGDTRANEAVENLLNSPMLDGGKVFDSTESILVSLTGGPDMALAEVGQVMDRIKAVAQNDANVMVGTIVDENWTGKIGVSLFAAEEWVDGKRASDDIDEDATGKTTRKKAAPKQIQIEFVSGKGRFKDVAPTIMNSEDLDVPTFIRRGISLARIVS